METNLPPSTKLTGAELEELRRVLALKYPEARTLVGAQLGAVIRSCLPNPDHLKTRFGGLKAFVASNLPADVMWQGKQGADDLYKVDFSRTSSADREDAWEEVLPSPSPSLWSAVTNPTVNVQFAWVPATESLMRSASGVPYRDGYVALQKLSTADYKDLAEKFAQSTDDPDVQTYLQAIRTSSSNFAFTKLIRERNMLSQWEAFRVDHAVQLFASRLEVAGANSVVTTRWVTLLHKSQRELRDQKIRKANLGTSFVAATQTVSSVNSTRSLNARDLLEARDVATKAIEFLSDADLGEMRFPLNSVLNAVRFILASR